MLIELIENYSFYQFTNHRQNRDRPVVVGVISAPPPPPSLYTGDTLASFHSSGKIPVVIDKFMIWVKDGGTIGVASFSRRQDIPSGPLALFNGS